MGRKVRHTNGSNTSPGFAELPGSCNELIVRCLLDVASPFEVNNVVSACKALNCAWQAVVSSTHDCKRLVSWVLEHEDPGKAIQRMLRVGAAGNGVVLESLAASDQGKTLLSE